MTDKEVLQRTLRRLQIVLQEFNAYNLSWSHGAWHSGMRALKETISEIEEYLDADQGLPGSQL